MHADKIAYERVQGLENTVRIPLADINDPAFITEVLQDTFETCLRNGDTRIIVDLKNFQFPNASLIALLIEATSRARRMNGDVKIVNLSRSAKNNLTTFSPVSFLSIEDDESFAIQEFYSDSSGADRDEMPEVDIVEDPIINQLEASFEAPGEQTEEIRHHIRVESQASNLYQICDFVTGFANQAGFTSKEIGKTKIAVYEACLNVIEHAYHSKPDNWIDVWVDFDEQKFTIKVKDYGVGFQGFSNENYDVVGAMDGRQTGGFGLYIIRRSMDEIEYKPDEANGNSLKMVKYLNVH